MPVAQPIEPPPLMGGTSVSPPVLELDSISLARRGRFLLDRVSLSVVGEGEVCGILGPNGAGKTSLLRVITGLWRSDSGTVRIRGEVSPAGRMPKEMGGLIEEPRFYPWLSARENLMVAAGGRKEWMERVEAVLAAVGLDERAADKTKAFSQGMRQRLGIARVLLGGPRLVILDEPSNGLDPEGIAWLRTLVASLSEKGTTVLITSHVLAEIEKICQTVLVMGSGRILARGAIKDILVGFSSVEDLYFSLSECPLGDSNGASA